MRRALSALAPVATLASTLAVLVIHAPSATAAGSSLAEGETLSTGEALMAPDGSHRLVMQGDGNLVLYSAAGHAVWASRTVGQGVRLVMQGDGNAVLYTPTNEPLWATRTATRGSRLVVQSDGNAVLYTSINQAMWASAWDRSFATTTVLWAGGTLSAGESLVSSRGSYRAVMQHDGNAVVYGPGNVPRWASRTGSTGSRLVMQSDGNLVVYDEGNRALWHSRTAGLGGNRVVMQDDGNLVVYTADNRPVFASDDARAAVRTLTFVVAQRGNVGTDFEQFAAHAGRTLEDYRGWALDGALAYQRVLAGGDFTLWLAEASTMTSFSSGCSTAYSCRVGRDVVINEERWRAGTPSWTLGLDAYRSYVVNHEVGHWLGLEHVACPAAGWPAPVMQQQSISLQGCAANVWPLQEERSAVGRGYGV